MPTIFTHGIAAYALGAKARAPGSPRRRAVLATATVLAMLPDLDAIGFQFSVQYNSLFGHRGFTHSFFFAALVGLLGAALLHRRDRAGFLRTALLLFAATASHPLLDALTDGGEGVALLSPFSNHRYFFPWRPIMVSPIGVSSFFRSLRGPLVLVDEALLVIVPTLVLFHLGALRSWASRKPLRAIAAIALWALGLAALKGLYPLDSLSTVVPRSGLPTIDLITKQYKNAALEAIPTYGIPGGKLVTGFGDFQRLGLYNRRLEAEGTAGHWGSGFFPNWFGGVAGRWQDSNARLTLRTLLGFGPPDAREIREALREAPSNPALRDFLFRLSPTEKYDLALGDYQFSATRAVLSTTHNASEMPHYWYGICNGMAAAAKWYQEPFRSVDVINPNGFHVRFHPNDVKALLGFSLAEITLWTEIGTRCYANGPEADACRMNPGLFFLATMNRIALAHDAFIVDGFAGVRKQFYLFDAVRVEVLQDPRPLSAMPGWQAPTPVKYLTKVRFSMEFVSTLLGDKAGGTTSGAGRDDSFFGKVGRVTVPKTWEAMLALGQHGEVLGGAWLGEDDVTDVIFFPAIIPSTDKEGRLKTNPALTWQVIKRIYDESVNPKEAREPVDFSL